MRWLIGHLEWLDLLILAIAISLCVRDAVTVTAACLGIALGYRMARLRR